MQDESVLFPVGVFPTSGGTLCCISEVCVQQHREDCQSPSHNCKGATRKQENAETPSLALALRNGLKHRPF